VSFAKNRSAFDVRTANVSFAMTGSGIVKGAETGFTARRVGHHRAGLAPASRPGTRRYPGRNVLAHVPAHARPQSQLVCRVMQTPEGRRRYTDFLFWSSFATVSGLPATVAPVGFTPNHLPVGIQILGPWLEDATSIFVAQSLEPSFGFKIPKGFE